MKMVLVLGIVLMWGVQPLFLIGALIVLVIGYSVYIYWGSNCFWLSYILMLVMLSGVLVIFSYMMSLFPNSELESSDKFIVFVILLGGLLFSELNFSSSDFSIMSNQIWGGILSEVTLFMLIFLLSVMIMVVWLSMMDEGSLREFLCAWLKG